MRDTNLAIDLRVLCLRGELSVVYT